MPISPAKLQHAMAILADEDELKVTVKYSGYGFLIAGSCSGVGGLLVGPPGLFVGGVLGGALAYLYATLYAESFKPVSQVIKSLSAHERQQLYDTMEDIINDLTIDDVLALITSLRGDLGSFIREQLMERLVSFLTNQMHLQVLTSRRNAAFR